MTDFHFIISYLSEKFNDKADSLTRRAEDISNKKNDCQTQQNQTLLSFERFDKDLQTVELTIISNENRLSLMQKMHDQFAIDHSKINKTLKLLKRNHHWSRMLRDVKQYIKNCHICRRIKTARDKYHELLNSLSTFDRSWTDIILDFVTRLLNNKE